MREWTFASRDPIPKMEVNIDLAPAIFIEEIGPIAIVLTFIRKK